MIDDTVERIRNKNHRLMDELKSMIQDNKLTPIDMNMFSSDDNEKFKIREEVEKNKVREEVDKSKVENDKSGVTLSSTRIPRLTRSPRNKGSNQSSPVVKEETSIKSSQPKPNPIRTSPTRSPIRPSKDKIQEKEPFKEPKTVKFPSLSYEPTFTQPSSLLLQKINNQDKEIENLKALVKQLKNENNSLKQDNYQYQSHNNKLIKQSNGDIERLKESYEKQLKQKDLQTNELKNEIENSNLLINQYKLMDRNKDNKMIALKEIITSINIQINEKSVIINDQQFEIEDLKNYNKLVKRLIQSVIEKFNKNLDKISEIIDNNYIEKGLLGNLSSPQSLKFNYDEDDTSDLLYNNTTKQLIKTSISPSLDKLFLNNDLVKTPLVKFKIAAKFVLFLVKLKKSRRH
ncbi:hypothetical protein CLIB1444_13S00584 [[Candida] jaroonii]|uniref:Uncharacterized protein n=1 Tax=[Candida] jaroonii TaxID=467808 RepID=A0ACA9YDF9_9ASCO|nr:hypothetical protein CLIB1444_13S00584 [[Candida] jaroonii]